MKIFSRIFQLLYFLYAALLFLALMIPVAIFALLASPAGALRGGNMIQKACRLWADIWFPLVGIFHRNTFEQPAMAGGPHIYIVNHISWLDAALVMKAFRKPMRPLGKAEIGKVPVFGFIYLKAIVSVDRSSPEARQRSVQRLKSVLRKGISVLVFPEGTFNETGKPLAPFYDGAFRIAIETSTPLKPVLFLDTYDRMPYHRASSLNPGRSRAIFLEEIPVSGLTPDDVPALREQAYKLMEEKLRTFGASWIAGEQK
jgi:1-acyl-sn-glycerol-3-phosphate acyltransferase